MADIDDKMNKIVENYKPKTKIENENKNSFIIFLPKLNTLHLIFFLHCNTTFDLHKKHQHDEIASILKKYSIYGRSIDEINHKSN